MARTTMTREQAADVIVAMLAGYRISEAQNLKRVRQLVKKGGREANREARMYRDLISVRKINIMAMRVALAELERKVSHA